MSSSRRVPRFIGGSSMAERTRAQLELDLCERALALAESERSRFLDDACGKDQDLRKATESLLEAVSDSGTFLIEPAGLPKRKKEG